MEQELRTIRLQHLEDITRFTDLTQEFLDRVQVLEAKKGSRREEISALRQEINDILETRSTLAQEMDTYFSRVAIELRKLENPPSKPSRTTKEAKPTVVPLPKPSRLSRKHGLRDKYNEDSDKSLEGSPQKRATTHCSHSPSSGSGSESSESEERRQAKPRAPKGRQHCGTRYPGLKALLPTNTFYKEFMSYWTFRVENPHKGVH